MIAARVKARIRRLPDRPGIYIFRGADGRPLYVGKARSLRKRGAAYLSRSHEPRLEVMLAEARDLDSLVTDSEAEALLLENNWIKKNRPRFNILLRDDKTYPYVKLPRDEYPRIAFTRRIRDDGGEYFGPYLPGGLARKAIKLVQKLFQIRVCTIPIDGSLPRPCLYYDMRRCLGPCVAGLTTRADYDRAVEEARLFLAGRSADLLRRLKRDMQAAADALEFEEAARLRDLIAEVEVVSQRRKLSSVRGEDVNIYGVAVHGGNAALLVLVMRGGQVLDRREIFWEGSDELSAERLVGELLPQIYDRTTFIPREIHLPVAVDGAEALEEWLSRRKRRRVYIRMPSRGPKAQRVALANRNAELAYRRRFRGGRGQREALAALAARLELDGPPRRVEGFDISNFQGAQTVASLVVCEDGKMRKGEYRSFNIKGLDGPNDLAAMKQAVSRRYRRRLEEIGEMPDLVLVDGGRGQVNAAHEALAELGVEETPLVGLAKREEEIYRVAAPEPLRLARSDPALHLLQQIRDEAHRFAVHRHRRRRQKGALRSRLDDAPGIGPKRRRALLRRFGSLAAVRAAGREELEEALGPTVGRRLHRFLHPPGRSRGSARADNVG